MYTNCDEIFKLTIPAARAAVAKALNKKYEMSQQQIARSLGVAQAAISKYLSGRYSSKIKMVERVIESRRYEAQIAKKIADKEDKRAISSMVDELAAKGDVVKEALKLI